MTYTNSPIIVQTTPAGLRYLAPIDDKNTVIAKESVNGNELDIMRLMVCWNAMVEVDNPDKLVAEHKKMGEWIDKKICTERSEILHKRKGVNLSDFISEKEE